MNKITLLLLIVIISCGHSSDELVRYGIIINYKKAKLKFENIEHNDLGIGAQFYKFSLPLNSEVLKNLIVQPEIRIYNKDTDLEEDSEFDNLEAAAVSYLLLDSIAKDYEVLTHSFITMSTSQLYSYVVKNKSDKSPFHKKEIFFNFYRVKLKKRFVLVAYISTIETRDMANEYTLALIENLKLQ